MYTSFVNFNTKLKESTSLGQPITEYDPSSSGCRDFVRLARELMAMGAGPSAPLPASTSMPAELLAHAEGPLCYVLETGGLADTLALERITRLHGLPSPTETVHVGTLREPRLIVLRRAEGVLFRRPKRRRSTRLKRLVEAVVEAGGGEVLLVPVAIYWGRSPDKERSWFKLLFLENWNVVGRTRSSTLPAQRGSNW